MGFTPIVSILSGCKTFNFRGHCASLDDSDAQVAGQNTMSSFLLVFLRVTYGEASDLTRLFALSFTSCYRSERRERHGYAIKREIALRMDRTVFV